MSTPTINALTSPPRLSSEMPAITFHLIQPSTGGQNMPKNLNIQSTPLQQNVMITGEDNEVNNKGMFLSVNNNQQGQHKHVSMRYGMQFCSSVTLISSRSQSMGKNQIGLEGLERKELNAKVLLLLQSVIKNRKVLIRICQSFKETDKEMKLSVRKSRQSIASSLSQQLSTSSANQVESNESVSPLRKSQEKSSAKENQSGSLPKLGSIRNSLMSKSNRISLIDSIKNQAQILKEIEPIQSSQSIATDSLADIKSRQDLASIASQAQDQLPPILLDIKPQGGKKISIMMCQEIDITSGSSLFSEDEEVIELDSLSLPELVMTAQLINNFFQQSSPFLLNLALCLFFKLLSKEVIKLDNTNVGWLLCISTVVAYKVYYDQTIECLMDFFAEELSLSLQDMAKLQRWFLHAINYELVVSSQQYQNTMMEVLSANRGDKEKGSYKQM